MNISFQYNWPPGNKYVRISFGMANVEDSKYLFRAGLVKRSAKTKVYWQGPAEWLTHEQLKEIKFDVERGDLVVVDKQDKDTGETVLRHRWDTEKDWPSEAYGASSTHVPFDF